MLSASSRRIWDTCLRTCADSGSCGGVREGRLDVLPLEVGRWWGTNPVEHCKEEIDVVLSGVDG